ncbi:hypothetical protein, partial [Bacillus cereus]
MDSLIKNQFLSNLSANPQLQTQGFDFGGLIESVAKEVVKVAVPAVIGALQAGPNAQNINTLSA